jgi:hypothetical protein
MGLVEVNFIQYSASETRGLVFKISRQLFQGFKKSQRGGISQLSQVKSLIQVNLQFQDVHLLQFMPFSGIYDVLFQTLVYVVLKTGIACFGNQTSEQFHIISVGTQVPSFKL